jgi:hypothetical protein
VLAGSKKIAQNVEYFTHISKSEDKESADLKIAKLLCQQNNLKHQVIRYDSSCAIKVQDSLEDRHKFWHSIDYEMSKVMCVNDILIKGSCVEVARNSFGLIGNKEITAMLLCHLFAIPVSNWSIIHIGNWIRESKPFCDSFGYRILDLFYWEHRIGCWQAICQNESDYYFDTFSPFNNRELLETMLAVPVKERIPPKFNFYCGVLNKLNPKVLEVTINPQYNKLSTKMKRVIKYTTPMLYAKLLKIRYAGGNPEH